MKYVGKYFTIQHKGWYIEGWVNEDVSTIDIEVVKCIVEERLRFLNGKEYPLIVHMKGCSITKEARLYMRTDGTVGIKGVAFIVEDVFTKFVLNFFVTVSNPQVPTRLFGNTKEALIWLEQYKEA